MSTEILPPYTPEVLPRYDLTPTTSRASSVRSSTPTSLALLSRARDRPTYRYVSERMDLDLGPRRWGTWLPTYGRNGLVEGTVTVRSFKHVDRIVVRTRILLHESTELWSSSSASSSSQPTPTTFSFSFTLRGNEQLPPSSSIQLRKANAHIAYAVRVDMYRRGVYMHEAVQTEILHLPRTTSRYSQPFVPSIDPTNEKRSQMDPFQWHRIGSSPSLLLPRERQYPSGQTIPFIVIPASDHSSKTLQDVELVRIRTVKTRTGTVQKSELIARGRQTDICPDQTINGILEATGKEVSWEVPGVGGVGYEIRFGGCVEPVELVSHEWRGENAANLPALELEAVERRALNLIDMSVSVFPTVASRVWREVEAHTVIMDLVVEKFPADAENSGGSQGTHDSLFDFTRFGIYAPFVRQILVYSRAFSHYSHDLRRICAYRAQQGALLPNVTSITLLMSDRDPSSLEAFCLLDILFTPSLQVFEVGPAAKISTAWVSYPFATRILQILVTTCTGIERLELHPMDIAGDDNNHASDPTNILWPFNPLDFGSCARLQTTTSSIGILSDGGFLALGALPRLQFLTLHGRGDQLKEPRYSVPGNSFPSLTHLSLLNVDTISLPALMG
ncbi:hypothetical protein FRC07_004909, partial [Ceratobasidium sp. 392]